MEENLENINDIQPRESKRKKGFRGILIGLGLSIVFLLIWILILIVTEPRYHIIENSYVGPNGYYVLTTLLVSLEILVICSVCLKKFRRNAIKNI